MPAGQAPYSEYNKDEEIEAVFSPLSVVSRMTPDIYQMMFGNKALIELKRQVQEIFDEL